MTWARNRFQQLCVRRGGYRNRHDKADIIAGRHHIIVLEYSYERMLRFIRESVESAVGAS